MEELFCPLYLYLNLDVLFCEVRGCGFFPSLLTEEMEFDLSLQLLS